MPKGVLSKVPKVILIARPPEIFEDWPKIIRRELRTRAPIKDGIKSAHEGIKLDRQVLVVVIHHNHPDLKEVPAGKLTNLEWAGMLFPNARITILGPMKDWEKFHGAQNFINLGTYLTMTRELKWILGRAAAEKAMKEKRKRKKAQSALSV